MHKRWWLTLLAALAVFVLAVSVRFYHIQQYPPGLFPDQAANGDDALLILKGDMRPFYPRGNGREALFFYLQALMIHLYGIGVWPMFVASAMVGSLVVVAIYFATKVYFGRMAATLAALFSATSYWHITISRTGFRAGMIPLFVAAFTAFVGYTISTRRKEQWNLSYLFATLAGASFSLGFYTYIAYRSMVGVVLGVVLLLLIAAFHPKIGFPHARRYGVQLVLGLVAVLLFILPLALYFVHHPDAFVGRASQVSVFNPDLQKQFGGGTLMGTIWYSTRETILSFFVGQGDLNWRQSVPGHPMVNPLTGFFFLLGLAWAFRGCWLLAVAIFRGKEIHLNMIYVYLVLVLLGMLAPVATTAEGIPHGLRSIGLFVPVMMLSGVAAAVAIRWLLKRFHHSAWRSLVMGVIAGLLIVFSVYDVAVYFLISPASADAYYAYRGDLTTVAAYLNDYRAQHPDRTRPYLVLDLYSVQTIHYLASVSAHDYDVDPDEKMHKYTLVDPATSSLTALEPGEVIVFTQSTIPDADRYAAKWGEHIELLQSEKNRWGQEIMRVYGSRVLNPAGEANDLDAQS